MNLFSQQPYPLAAFTPLVESAAREVAQRAQVTEIIAATSCLTALSVAVSPHVDWRHPITGKLRPCVLYQAIVAISGDRKSTAEELACQPIFDHDAMMTDQIEMQSRNHSRELARWRAGRHGLLKRIASLVAKGEPTGEVDDLLSIHEEGRPRRGTGHLVMQQEATHLHVFESLVGEGRGIALTTDEGARLLSSSVMRNYGFLNNAWDGKPLMTIGRTDEQNMVVRHPRLTLSFMVQPGVFQRFLESRGDETKSSGLWARFLISRSPSIQGMRQVQRGGLPPPDALVPFYERIRQLLSRYQVEQGSGPKTRDVLEFDSSAKELWYRIAANVESDLMLGGFLADINDFGNKYMDIVGRIACLLWYVEVRKDPAGVGSGECGRISEEMLARAESIAAWHLYEYKAVFSPVIKLTPEQHDANLLYRFLHRAVYGPGALQVPKNFVRQNCGVRGAGGRFDSALAALRSWGALNTSFVKLEGERKPTEIVFLNPQYFGVHPPMT